jgi:hypothetical protein
MNTLVSILLLTLPVRSPAAEYIGDRADIRAENAGCKAAVKVSRTKTVATAVRSDSLVSHGVIRVKNGKLLPSAVVVVDGTRSGALTTQDGRYTFAIAHPASNTVKLRVRRIGFQQVLENINLKVRILSLSISRSARRRFTTTT